MHEQLELKARTWGGRREGAGRKPTGQRREPAHRARGRFSRHEPEHVVLRVRPEVGSLRREEIFAVVRASLERIQRRVDFRVVQFSLQDNHLHLIIEADSRDAMSRGMQALEISLTHRINHLLGRRRGKVFAYRYHTTSITCPRQTRHTLAYVLLNWRHHDEDETSPAAHEAILDRYSSAVSFDGWATGTYRPPAWYTPAPVSPPRTWLLRVGWRRHGRLDPFAVPGHNARDAR